jgi:hypothetical protein
MHRPSVSYSAIENDSMDHDYARFPGLGKSPGLGADVARDSSCRAEIHVGLSRLSSDASLKAVAAR